MSSRVEAINCTDRAHAWFTKNTDGMDSGCDDSATKVTVYLDFTLRWSRFAKLVAVSDNLTSAVDEPDNIKARGAMLVASCLGGIAFLKGLGLVHAISHMVGAEFDTHHGLTNAIVLPVVTRYNFPELEGKVQRMSSAMHYEDSSVEAFISNLDELLNQIEIPKSLDEIGVPIDCVKRISEKAMKDSAYATNPRIASLEDMNQLVYKASSKREKVNDLKTSLQETIKTTSGEISPVDLVEYSYEQIKNTILR